MDTNNKILSLRIDKKQLINQLKAMNDSYIELWVDPNNLKYITLKDRFNINRMTTKN